MIDDLPYYTLRRRLLKLEEQVNEPWENWSVKQDLKKLLKNAQSAINELNKEVVNCRRIHKLTSQYYYLEEAAELVIHTLEKRITWARLLD